MRRIREASEGSAARLRRGYYLVGEGKKYPYRLKMRTASLYDRFMRELGMVPVNINAPETYTALAGNPHEYTAERSVIEGFLDPDVDVPWAGGVEPPGGDFDAAIELLRKKGQKVAAKRADRED